MRILISILCFAFCNSLIAQTDIIETDSLLLWQPERKLSWNDFKGKPKENPINEGAIINVTIRVSLKKWDKDVPIFKVNTYMKKFSSWNLVSDSLSLKHEQGHFDIHELHARKIRKAYDSLNSIKIEDVKLYENTFKKLFDECRKMNHSYEYTNFNLKSQNDWIVKIAEELEKLKKYSNRPKYKEDESEIIDIVDKNYNCVFVGKQKDINKFLGDKYRNKGEINAHVLGNLFLFYNDETSLMMYNYKPKMQILETFHNISVSTQMRNERKYKIKILSYTETEIQIKIESIKDKSFTQLKDDSLIVNLVLLNKKRTSKAHPFFLISIDS